jgi:uncharacterized protein YndB with AHSA1/START domain
MTKSASRAVVVEEVLQHPVDVVWRALTTGELIGRWLMPNDFEPVVGKKFTFRTQPMVTGTESSIARC